MNIHATGDRVIIDNRVYVRLSDLSDKLIFNGIAYYATGEVKYPAWLIDGDDDKWIKDKNSPDKFTQDIDGIRDTMPYQSISEFYGIKEEHFE